MKNELETVRSVFSEYAKRYADRFMNVDTEKDVLNAFNGLLMGKNVLDLGSGPGNIAAYLQQLNADLNFTLVDISEKMLEIANGFVSNAITIVSDVKDIDNIKGEFDGILLNYILPYIKPQELDDLLRGLHLKLNADGILLIHTMEDDSEASGFESSSTGEGPELFINYYPAQYLIEQLEQVGFTSILGVRNRIEDAEYKGDISLIAFK